MPLTVEVGAGTRTPSVDSNAACSHRVGMNETSTSNVDVVCIQRWSASDSSNCESAGPDEFRTLFDRAGDTPIEFQLAIASQDHSGASVPSIQFQHPCM